MTNVAAGPQRRSGHRNTSLITALDDCVDLYALHRSSRQRYPFLLQSTAPNSTLGRYDILFASPGESLVLDAAGELSGYSTGSGFLRALDQWWSSEQQAMGSRPQPALPFLGGWFLYLGYELAQEIEPALDLTPDRSLPCAFAVRCKAAIVRDNLAEQCYVVQEQGADFDIEQLYSDISNSNTIKVSGDPVSNQEPKIREEAGRRYKDAVERAKQYISAGDVYQANLSRGWAATIDNVSMADRIYSSLGHSNPGPFAGIAHWQNTSIVSSSPERLLSVRDGIASTRPIAGTRPRSEDRLVDDSLSAELFANQKERAEHVMLIDLERNDLGRICTAGSVVVDEMMVLESYAHVHHIVSNVSGQIRAEVTPGEAIAAVFPGGTITGCPKVRCMQIIHELECSPRGAYTGSFGYLNRDGSLDLNILIRTMVLKDREISFRAGSGIVADSQPEAELAETRAKAKGLLQAISQ